MLRLTTGLLLTVQSLVLAGGLTFIRRKGIMNHCKEEKDHCHGLNLLNMLDCFKPFPPPSPPPPPTHTHTHVVYSTDRSKAVVPVLVLLFLALWFILRGDLLYVFPCVILFLCFSVLLVLRLPILGKRELILVLFVRLFDLCLFGFVGFLFLLGSGKGCVL